MDDTGFWIFIGVIGGTLIGYFHGCVAWEKQCADQSIADKKEDWWLKAVYAAQLRKKPHV